MSVDLIALTSPTPSDPGVAEGVGRAPSIRAPLIWSGVHDGFRARICAAIPETIGAANALPDSGVWRGPTMFAAFCTASVELIGIGPTMKRPSADTSGFEKPSFV